MTWGEGRSGAERRNTGGSPAGQGPQFHRRSDDRIQEEIWELLSTNADLDASEVELQVESGADLVTSVTGVREGNNRLKVAR